MRTRVHVHATFTVSKPTTLFVVAVEVLEGTVTAGDKVRIPFSQSMGMTVRISAIAPVNNDFGISLLGLVLDCENTEGIRSMIDCMNIGDETWTIISDETE